MLILQYEKNWHTLQVEEIKVGLNAAVRSIFYRAKDKYKMDVFGILEGTVGLMNRPVSYIKLDYNTFSGNLLRQGGTFLGPLIKEIHLNFQWRMVLSKTEP